MAHELSVRLSGQPVGILRLNSGSMLFQYENAAKALSFSMPIRPEPYTNKACEAFFGGLLPDNVETKKLIAKLYGISSSSNFGLLEKIGFDCAGAVSLDDPLKPVSEQAAFRLEGKLLTEELLCEHLKELPTRPLFVGVEGIRISLAGAQEKAALCVINDQLCIPGPGVPTTHILKTQIRGLEQSVANEYMCMVLARAVNLTTPRVELCRAGDVEYLLVERYDRAITQGEITRIHQEDFCQALGVVSTKYQADGGPSLQECFKLLDRTTYPAIAKIELLKRVIFNYVIGNADCHAKNFALLHGDTTSILAPTYDVLCTAVYVVDSKDRKISTKFAMAIGGESDMHQIRLQNWKRFCELIKVSPAAYKRTCTDLTNQIIKVLPEIQSHISEIGHQNEVTERVLELIKERAEELRKTVSEL
jgi:serine/threonine-protein kinase HipA